MSLARREFQLLLACARAGSVERDLAEIRKMVCDGIDWPFFLRETVDHSLVYQAQRKLQALGDLVPRHTLGGLTAAVDHARARNRELLDATVHTVQQLATQGVDAIPIDGPGFLRRAYGDMGVRAYDRVRLLIRHRDLGAARAALTGRGYQGEKRPDAQLDLIQYVRGSETFTRAGHSSVQLHTQIVPRSLAVELDYAGIRSRAVPPSPSGLAMSSLATEDELILLAVACGWERWRKVSRVCDLAAFMSSSSDADWEQVVARARSQKCARMVSWSVDLARTYFGARLPEKVPVALEIEVPTDSARLRIAEAWYVDSPGTGRTTPLLDRLPPHDTVLQSARFVLRTLFLPSPAEMASVWLPAGLSRARLPLAAAYRALSWSPRQIHRRLKYRRMRLVLVCGPWGSGTSAVAGMLEALGARGFSRYYRTDDDRTPVTFEFIAFGTTVQRYVSYETLARRAVSETSALAGLRRLRREIELQKHGPYDPRAPEPIFFKYPLSALLLPQICKVFDTRLIYVMRPLEEIEESRARRKWPANSGRRGAEVVYGEMERFAQRHANPILRIAYADLRNATSECAHELARFTGLEPDSSSFARAIELVRSN